MAAVESAAVPSGLAAAGITIFGMATGIDPSLIVGGIAGGWWALIQFEVQATPISRLLFVVLSALLGVLLTPLVAAIVLAMAPDDFPLQIEALRTALSVLIGLLAIKWVGPHIVTVASKAADKAGEKI